ncbi:MAG: hypothetical protein MJ185_01875 [Treponema sp.]|nr:hypothetical protein [Treponema sp.]
MKKTLFAFCLVTLISLTVGVSAETKKMDRDTFVYADAVDAFESGNYGRALKLCEDAVLSRKQKMSGEIKLLKDACQPQEVSRVGDKISEVLPALLSRDEYEAVKLIQSYLNKKGEDYFENSVNKLFSYLESILVFPEAQKLMGDIYKIEGEYDFAEMYYKEALKNAEVLDIPDEKYDILYLLAEISYLKGENDQREARLLSVLSEDKVLKDRALVNSMTRCIRQNKKDSVQKFFNLYRADSFYMMKAYSQLSEYYLSEKHPDKALEFVSLEVITGFTKILGVIQKRDISYEYEGLESFLFQCSLYPDLVQWGTENGLWKGFYNLAVISQKNDCYLFADSLIKILAEYLPEEYYRKAAVLLIK